MNFTIGHVLIKTNNFREAVKDFEKLGFQVTYGGTPQILWTKTDSNNFTFAIFTAFLYDM